MKLFDGGRAPNPRRVRIFLAEKGVEVPLENIDMSAMDSNGDGRISRAEARSNPTLTAEFRAVDNNGDGVLDAGELKGWMR